MAPTPSTLAPRPTQERTALDDRSLPPTVYDRSLMEWMAGTGAAWDSADDTAPRAAAHPRRTARPRTLMETVTATHMAVVAPRPAVERQTTPRTRGLPAVAAPSTARTLVIPAAPHAPHAPARPAATRALPRLVVAVLLLAVVGLGVLGQRLLPVDAASACAWHTVVPNDTLGNLGYWNHSSALTIARANHIANPNRIYVGQKLCIPQETWAAAHHAPPVPQGQTLAVPIIKPPAQQPPAQQAPVHQAPAPAPAASILPGEPCAGDRAIVWTVPVSRWAVPPGCFGGVYSPNPYAFQVNGHVIPGFGWCNWWPEALLRDPNAIFKPGHATPRVGAAVYWAPQPGDRTGHYGFVESIGPNGWILISEMNMYWRGAGWAKVNYRYIRVGYPGASYRY